MVSIGVFAVTSILRQQNGLLDANGEVGALKVFVIHVMFSSAWPWWQVISPGLSDEFQFSAHEVNPMGQKEVEKSSKPPNRNLEFRGKQGKMGIIFLGPWCPDARSLFLGNAEPVMVREKREAIVRGRLLYMSTGV